MSQAFYDGIARWYDTYLRENVLYREMLLPTLLSLIGDIQGQDICDLACGQGWIARELAQRGAQVTGMDLSAQLLALAREYEEQKPLGITYMQGDVQRADVLTDQRFDGCVCMWSLVDIPDLSAVFQAVWQLLKPQGWLIFAITHPCFETPHAQWISLDDGSTARAIKGYFREGFWQSTSDGVRGRVGAYHRTLSAYLNTLTASGFVFEQMREPTATSERAGQETGSQEVPSLLFIRAHKGSM